VRHVYEFCGHAAVGSGKSGDPILHREPSHFKKILAMRRAILKITEGCVYISLDLIYDLKG
jgi:hypothetical protein